MKKLIVLLTITGIFVTGGWITGCNSDNNTQETAETHADPQEEQHSGETGRQHAEESGERPEQGGEHAGEVHLSDEQRQTLAIEVGTLSSGSAASTISRPASVRYDLDKIAKVGPRIEAKVVRMLKDLGDPVQEGEALALMSSVELGKAKADYLRLKARLKAEQARYKREQSLYKQEISSEAELLEAEANYQEAKAELNAVGEALRLYGLSKEDIRNIEAGTDEPLSRFYVTSPIDGVVQERDLSPGQTLSSGETPIHISNVGEMWIMIDAYEQDIPYIEKGQKVTISVRSIPKETFEGTIDWISYALEEGSRTMPVRADVNNTDGKLRSGMFGTARISTGKKRSIAMVPVDAVQTIEGENKVFVPGEESGSFRPITVRLGAENEGMVEIASGLEPGDKVVTGGAFDLKSALTSTSRSADH